MEDIKKKAWDDELNKAYDEIAPQISEKKEEEEDDKDMTETEEKRNEAQR